jgi:hypothetical protein
LIPDWKIHLDEPLSTLECNQSSTESLEPRKEPFTVCEAIVVKWVDWELPGVTEISMLSRSRSRGSVLLRRCLSSGSGKEVPRPPRLDSNSPPQKVWNKLVVKDTAAFMPDGMAKKMAAKRLGISSQDSNKSNARTLMPNRSDMAKQRHPPRAQENRTRSPPLAATSNVKQGDRPRRQQLQQTTSEPLGNKSKPNAWTPRKFNHSVDAQRGPQSSNFRSSNSKTQSSALSQRSRKPPRFKKQVEDDPNEDMSRYQVDFPKGAMIDLCQNFLLNRP